jgi:hypothetical protein
VTSTAVDLGKRHRDVEESHSMGDLGNQNPRYAATETSDDRDFCWDPEGQVVRARTRQEPMVRIPEHRNDYNSR